MTVEATSASGATVSFDVIPTDETSPAHPAVTCDWLSGSTFSLGATPVTCEATDDAKNTGYGYFNVTVQDTTPPFLSLPANIMVPQSNSAGTVVNLPAGAWDGVDANPTVVCVPPGGSVFPVGAPTVICTATDDYAHASNGSFTVTVIGGVNLLLNPGFDGFTAIPKALDR